MKESEELQVAKAEAAAQNAATGVIREEVTNTQLLTVARVKARFNAYLKISENLTKYFEKQTEELEQGVFHDSPYKELGIARLIVLWTTESEKLFKEFEPLLQDSEKTLRKGYLEQSFENLPSAVKDTLLREFNTKKQELLIWFVQRVQEALKEEHGEVIDV